MIEEQAAAAAVTRLVGSVDIPVELLRERAENPNHLSDEDFGRLVAAVRFARDRGWGFLQPVLVRPLDDGLYEIVDGVHRHRAAVVAGCETIPCVVRDIDDDEARILQIGMNRLRGELDLADVATQLAALSATWETGDLIVTGYSEDELRALISAAGNETPDDALTGATASTPEEPDDAPPKPFVLELEFTTHSQLTRVKRALRRAAGGKGRPLGDGLLAMIDGDK